MECRAGRLGVDGTDIAGGEIWRAGVDYHPAMGLFKRNKGPNVFAQSEARAVPASAKVVSARMSSPGLQTVNSSSQVYEVTLEVSRPGVELVTQTVAWTVFDIAIPDVQPGVELAVTVDPEVPAVVYPPGYPPPQSKPGVIALGDARILPTSSWLESLLE